MGPSFARSLGTMSFVGRDGYQLLQLRMLGVGFRGRSLGKQGNGSMQSKGGRGAGHKVKEV